MAMPHELIFVRHGQSEANIIQKSDEHGIGSEQARQLFERPDWQHRLTRKGRSQAAYAGEWIQQNITNLELFDALYVSPFLRTRETAAYLGGDTLNGWTIDDRLAERSWGVYGARPRAEQRAQFPLTAEEKKRNPWYVRLDGGESMPDVYGRFRDFQGTLHREQADTRVLVVSHGDFINAARYGIERMLPEEWEQLDSDRRYTLRNCTILHYSRVNPHNPEDIRDTIRWRRYIYPDTPVESPDGGAWIELPARRRYNGVQLIEQIEFSQPVLDDMAEL